MNQARPPQYALNDIYCTFLSIVSILHERECIRLYFLVRFEQVVHFLILCQKNCKSWCSPRLHSIHMESLVTLPTSSGVYLVRHLSDLFSDYERTLPLIKQFVLLCWSKYQNKITDFKFSLNHFPVMVIF